MKRILLACLLLTATFTTFSVQQATAQTITKTSFQAKVDQMDTYIGAGDMTNAQTTWQSIHADMIAELGISKNKIATASTPADQATYTTFLTNQRTIYSAIWQLHFDLTTNRTAIHTKLGDFDATIP